MTSLGCRSTASFVAPAIVAVSLALGLGPAERQDRAPAIQGSAPQLVFEAPEALQPVVERLRRRDPQGFARLTRLVGLEDAGPPIRVVVAAEDSPRARAADPWVSGYAFGEQGIVVLLPGRVPSYPYGSLEEVLDHELAHVLIARAAAGGSVPRWFNEGLAMVAGRSWGMGDRARLTLALLGGEAVSLGRIESRFGGGAAEVRRAYVLSGAFVRDVLARHGPASAAAILDGIAAGLDFPTSFRRATGSDLAAAEEAFWRRRTLWNRWVPVLTSSMTLWGAITLLALYAIRRRQQRSAAIRRSWEVEDEDQPADPGAPGGRGHGR
jgi:hypothetical protein